MDAARFDAWTRRRLSLAAGGFVAALFSLAALDDVGARKKRRKKKKKCPGGTKRCGRTCIPRASCCTDANCGDNAICSAGTCDCASGFEPCRGACIPDDACCTNDDCSGGAACEEGNCLCPADTLDCTEFAGGDCLPGCPDGAVCFRNSSGSSCGCPGGHVNDNGACREATSGELGLGALCDQQNPTQCSTGVCGCNGGICTCRRTDCVAPGAQCAGTNSCCQGVCQVGTPSRCSA